MGSPGFSIAHYKKGGPPPVADPTFGVGGSGFTILGNTPVYIDGLTLQPQSDLTLTSTTIALSNTPVAAAGGNSIGRVYSITPALSFSGTIGIYYQPGELNGNLAASLVLAYDEGGGFVAFPTSTTATNYVSKVVSSATTFAKLTALTPTEPPSVTLTNNGPLSCSATVTLTASTTSTVDSYTFTGPGGLVASVGNSATVTQGGTYTVVVSNAGGTGFATTVVDPGDGASTPVLTTNVNPGFQIIQNTPGVVLSISGCSGGTLNWSGPNSTTGTSASINVPTDAVASLAYSATCTIGSCVSSPGTATVEVIVPLAGGSLDGYIYGADCATFRGWAWDRNKPNTAISVEILDGPNVIATLVAGDLRQDLVTAGKGNGRHAFSFPIPDELKDGLSHSLSARVAGSSFILKNSPKALICTGTNPPPNKPPMPPSPTVLISALTAQVGVPFSGTLVAFTDPEGGTLTYGLSALPPGLNFGVENRIISGTPTEAGAFVMTYTATDPLGANNSVSFPLTVNPTSTTGVTGDFEGFLDKVECASLRGWVWDRKKPNTPLTVEFYTETSPGNFTVWGSTVANIYRVDLKNAGKGNGVHAYNFEVPDALKTGYNLISARVQGSTYVLKNSGRLLPLPCPAPGRLSAETAGSLQVVVLGNPVSDRLEVEVRGAEGQRVTFDLLDTQGRKVMERFVERAGAVERQAFSLSDQASGLLVLRVRTAGQSQILKVIKP
ncbi:hypothetical protein DUE52_10425 [Larkinella punicea]|uniref:Dystroglycan-type cadherin-like domain-containing protein n=2 Tax=Larkinella punicea TaxID=2315727 RepID=A0A368JQ00_9BACT|nr:hypothetical protein DUE52_10425 [Larkinella punicea]